MRLRRVDGDALELPQAELDQPRGSSRALVALFVAFFLALVLVAQVADAVLGVSSGGCGGG